VDLVIKHKKGVLMSLRSIEPWKGLWHLPGGTVYFGESLKKAAIRIAKAETGLNIEVKKILGIIELLEEIKLQGRHSVSVGLLCGISGGKLKGSFQGEEIDFFKKIPKNSIPNHKNFIENYA
jgi:ADP-ribose pyrophosphatase YjhB (NUDIX family)